MIDDRWRMSSLGLWQWAWKQGTSFENQSGLLCLGDILALGGWIWDDFRFSNWDNWVTILRIRKGSRMRFCQEVLSLFWTHEAWGTSSTSKWRCPEGSWNPGFTGVGVMVEPRPRDNEHTRTSSPRSMAQMVTSVLVNCMWLVICEHDPAGGLTVLEPSHTLPPLPHHSCFYICSP